MAALAALALPPLSHSGHGVELIVKVGNTNVVAALFKDGKIIEKMRFDYTEGWETRFRESLQRKEISVALIGSVNPKIAEAVSKALDLLPKENVHDAKEGLIALEVLASGLRPVPEWGADLLANAYGARVFYPGRNVQVIDVGTANTYTFVSKEGKLEDVFIAPGFGASVKGLILGTAAALPPGLTIPAFTRPDDASRGDDFNTIFNGIYWGFIGGCLKIAELAKARFFHGEESVVVATGGVTSAKDDISGYVPPNDLSERFRTDLTAAMPAVEFNADLTLIGFHQILQRIQAVAKK